MVVAGVVVEEFSAQEPWKVRRYLLRGKGADCPDPMPRVSLPEALVTVTASCDWPLHIIFTLVASGNRCTYGFSGNGDGTPSSIFREGAHKKESPPKERARGGSH